MVETLADWITSVRYEDVPERVLEKARYQTMNVVAALHAGADTHAGRAVMSAVGAWAGDGPCTVIPLGRKLPLADAVLVNSAFSMALDYDDYLYMGHTGHSAVLGSLAVCEEQQLATRDLLLAQVIANEIGGRIGASAVLGPQNGQAWSFIHAAEGAALAARLYGLSAGETAHALAIAMYQPTFTLWPGFMGPESKVLTAAGPTVTGIQAARFAREGLTGARTIFEHPRKGFWASFTFVPLPDMLGGLGRAWVTDTLAYKKYPGCAYIDTTMDALFMALAEHERCTGARLAADDVERVEIAASLLTVEMDNLSSEHVDASEPLSPVNINFSIPYNVAIGIAAGRHGARELRQSFLDDNATLIRRLAARTRLCHDWEMSLAVAEAFAGALGRHSPVRKLRPADFVRIARGYQSQMGGRKKHAIELGQLLRSGAARTRLATLIRRAPRRRQGDVGLEHVDFSRFRMVFPARVTLVTTRGERFTARQDVPYGAPGQAGIFDTVVEKLMTETEPRLGAQRATLARARLEELEHTPLEELVRSVCG